MKKWSAVKPDIYPSLQSSFFLLQFLWCSSLLFIRSPGTVQLDTLERSLGGHRSSSRPFIQQSDLPKVVRGSELTNLVRKWEWKLMMSTFTSLVSSPSAGHWVTIAFPSMMMKNSSPWSPCKHNSTKTKQQSSKFSPWPAARPPDHPGKTPAQEHQLLSVVPICPSSLGKRTSYRKQNGGKSSPTKDFNLCQMTLIGCSFPYCRTHQNLPVRLSDKKLDFRSFPSKSIPTCQFSTFSHLSLRPLWQP